MLPRVIIHNQASVDGRMDWVVPDLGLFYGIASRFGEEATLAGSNTTSHPARASSAARL